jgi:hypothetical protein
MSDESHALSRSFFLFSFFSSAHTAIQRQEETKEQVAVCTHREIKEKRD